MSESLIELRPPLELDAEALFPMIYKTAVTDTLVWEGPSSLEEYREALRTRGLQVAAGLLHFFTIVESATGAPIGSCDIRPHNDGSRALVGLWIGEPYQGRGLGTAVIGELARYTFEELDMPRLEAEIFVGNLRSRRAFERNGFKFLGMLSGEVVKRGEPVEEWRMGLEREVWRQSRRST
jgi:RimJ/RimL family protein N-acetyltransferase